MYAIRSYYERHTGYKYITTDAVLLCKGDQAPDHIEGDLTEVGLNTPAVSFGYRRKPAHFPNGRALRG